MQQQSPLQPYVGTMQHIFQQTWNVTVQGATLQCFAQVLEPRKHDMFNIACHLMDRYMVSSGGQWNENEAVNLSHAAIKGGSFYLISQQWGNDQGVMQAIQSLGSSFQWLNSQANIQQMLGAAQPYQQPPQQSYQPQSHQPHPAFAPNTQYQGNAGGWQQPQQPQQQSIQSSMGRTQTSPPGYSTPAATESSMVSAAFAQDTQTNNPSPQWEVTDMKQEDHLPNSDTAYEFTAAPAIDVESLKASTPAKSTKPVVEIDLVDLRATSVEGLDSKSSPLLSVYALCPEARTKPVLVRLDQANFVPIFNPTSELAEELGKLSGLNSVDSIYEHLIDISKRWPITGVLAWVDGHITRLVEMLLQKRYDKPNAEVSNYRLERNAVDGVLVKLGCLDTIHNVVVRWFHNAFAEPSYGECFGVDSNKDGDDDEKKVSAPLIELAVGCDYLTLPYTIRYTHSTNSVWASGVTQDQIEALLNHAFETVHEDEPFLIMADEGGNRFRAWRCAPGNAAPSKYFIESMDI